MTTPADAPLARLLNHLRNAETAGLGFADLVAAGDVSLREGFARLREALEQVQRARREYERTACFCGQRGVKPGARGPLCDEHCATAHPARPA